ncbi:MAG: hypothetical protein ACI4LD_06660, partial [Lentihominibacter sp.]
AELRKVCEQEDTLDILTPVLQGIKPKLAAGDAGSFPGPDAILESSIQEQTDTLEKGRRASALSINRQKAIQRTIAILESCRAGLIRNSITEGGKAFEYIREEFTRQVDQLRTSAEWGKAVLANAFDFCERAFEAEDADEKREIVKAGGDEILIFVTELTVNYYTARFIGHYGCDKYYMHNKELQFAERQLEISRRLDELDWEI